MVMRLVLTIGLAAAAASAHAQSTLDQYLKRSTEGSSSTTSSANEAGINKVYKSAEGYWRLDDTRATGGFCSITYVTPAYFVGFLGSSNATTPGLIIFNGPTIPPIKKSKRKTVTITAVDGSSQSMPAVHDPDGTYKEFGTIRLTYTSIQPAIDTLSDVENLTIVMDKRQVFAMKWKGGNLARAAMRKCLDGTGNMGGSKK